MFSFANDVLNTIKGGEEDGGEGKAAGPAGALLGAMGGLIRGGSGQQQQQQERGPGAVSSMEIPDLGLDQVPTFSIPGQPRSARGGMRGGGSRGGMARQTNSSQQNQQQPHPQSTSNRDDPSGAAAGVSRRGRTRSHGTASRDQYHCQDRQERELEFFHEPSMPSRRRNPQSSTTNPDEPDVLQYDLSVGGRDNVGSPKPQRQVRGSGRGQTQTQTPHGPQRQLPHTPQPKPQQTQQIVDTVTGTGRSGGGSGGWDNNICPLCQQTDMREEGSNECAVCGDAVSTQCGGRAANPETKYAEWTCRACVAARRGQRQQPKGQQQLGLATATTLTTQANNNSNANRPQTHVQGQIQQQRARGTDFEPVLGPVDPASAPRAAPLLTQEQQAQIIQQQMIALQLLQTQQKLDAQQSQAGTQAALIEGLIAGFCRVLGKGTTAVVAADAAGGPIPPSGVPQATHFHPPPFAPAPVPPPRLSLLDKFPYPSQPGELSLNPLPAPYPTGFHGGEGLDPLFGVRRVTVAGVENLSWPMPSSQPSYRRRYSYSDDILDTMGGDALLLPYLSPDDGSISPSHLIDEFFLALENNELEWPRPPLSVHSQFPLLLGRQGAGAGGNHGVIGGWRVNANPRYPTSWVDNARVMAPRTTADGTRGGIYPKDTWISNMATASVPVDLGTDVELGTYLYELNELRDQRTLQLQEESRRKLLGDEAKRLDALRGDRELAMMLSRLRESRQHERVSLSAGASPILGYKKFNNLHQEDNLFYPIKIHAGPDLATLLGRLSPPLPAPSLPCPRDIPKSCVSATKHDSLRRPVARFRSGSWSWQGGTGAEIDDDFQSREEKKARIRAEINRRRDGLNKINGLSQQQWRQNSAVLNSSMDML